MHERSIWLGKGVAKDDPLLVMLQERGVGVEALQGLCGNPSFPRDNGTPIFDLVEHTDTADCLELLLKRLKSKSP